MCEEGRVHLALVVDRQGRDVAIAGEADGEDDVFAVGHGGCGGLAERDCVRGGTSERTEGEQRLEREQVGRVGLSRSSVASYSAVVCGLRSATSISAERALSGVRSSWLASSMSCRCRSPERSSAS